MKRFFAVLFFAFTFGCLYSAVASRPPVLGDTCRAGPQNQYDEFEWSEVIASCQNAVARLRDTRNARRVLPLIEPEFTRELALVRDKSANYRSFVKLAQGGMMPGPGMVHSTGGAAASFTFGAQGSTGSQAASPFTVSAVTFNTAASDLAVFAIGTTGDLSAGHITTMQIAGAATLGCFHGVNNTADEDAWVCYNQPGVQTTANVDISHTGNLRGYWWSGKVVTTTATPSANDISLNTQGGGIATPFNFGTCTIPSGGVSFGIIGDYFSGARAFTTVTPNQAGTAQNDAAAMNAAAGYSTVAGAGGLTVSGTTGLFPAWAVVCWGP